MKTTAFALRLFTLSMLFGAYTPAVAQTTTPPPQLTNSTAQSKVTELSFSVILTAKAAPTKEAMIVGGGRWLESRSLVHTAIFVRHPKGDFLWDSGIGSQVEQQMEAFSFIDKQLMKIDNVKPASQQLQQHNYATENLMAIIPSHMHWDHVSGLVDFSGVPVWVQEQEHNGARKGKPPAFIKSQFEHDGLEWKYLKLSDTPFKGFESSLDVFGDGSVVLVDLSGHTAGQLGMFLTTAKGQFFFIGDATWALEGIENNRGRPVFVNWLAKVDRDEEKAAAVVRAIHELGEEVPELRIIPAHDENAIAGLPLYPEFY